MQVVHIYAECGSVAPRSLLRKTGYVLEYVAQSGQTVTREQFKEREETYNAATLQMITEGLQRLNRPCEVHVHTQNQHVLLMMDTKLEEWVQNGYQTARGKPIANKAEWEALQDAAKEHLVVIETGEHPYLEWLQCEMRKAERTDAPPIKQESAS